MTQAERAGVQVQKEIPGDVEPEKGFGVNPGQVHYQPDLSKYPATFKQQFLERINQFYSPDTLPGVTRSQFGELLKKTLRQADLQDLQTLVWAEEQGGIGGYKNWVGKVLETKQEKGELYPIGNLPLRVLGKLKQQPRLALVVEDDKAVIHLADSRKVAEGRALTAEEIASIPEQFATSKWYWDQKDPALLMTRVKAGDQWLKVVIRLDRKIGKGIANQAVSGGVVQANDIEKDKRYVGI